MSSNNIPSRLQKISANQMPKMVKLSSDIILASRNYPKIKSFGNAIDKPLRELLSRVVYDSGVNMTKEEIMYFLQSCVADIHDFFSMLTIEEIAIALRLGVRGKLCETYGINVRAVNQWLEYYKDVLKRKAEIEYSKAVITLPEARKEMTEEEKDKIHREWLDGVMESYEILRSGGEYKIWDINNTFYHFLGKLGILEISQESYLDYIKKAKKKYISNYVNNPKKTFKQNIETAIFVNQVEDENNENYNKHKPLVVKIARGMVLKDFLIDLANKDVDLKELIKSKNA